MANHKPQAGHPAETDAAHKTTAAGHEQCPACGKSGQSWQSSSCSSCGWSDEGGTGAQSALPD